uniref:Zinc finger and BTB domain containing 33 n=1 Tax=Cyprinus carpio TaxID=7962 RepID=A0A8C2F2D7_CYPCA
MNYTLRYTDTQYPASLLKSINDERHSGLFCDVTIIVQDRKFKAHKCVLSASSTYFRQLFAVAGQVIELNFIKADIFDVILNYIYTSKIHRVRSDRLEDLIRLPEFNMHSPDQPGKIRLSDVRPMYSTNNGPVPAINMALTVLGKKTITLDKASEIDSLSPGCKVYANIGENTYDIVPEKEDPVEGSAPGRKSQTPHGVPSVSDHSPRGKKKSKLDHEDHYELIMDGKTFYVCIVCKRPYVCLTSLRRHFNTHSWERKYPCHYCSKVFALAEYRTKHEITHTGERRYQCLLCNETFLNYQILSTHCKQMHNQDPSGRKEKDDSCNNLYRLLPCKTLQFKPYSFVSEEPGGIPVIGEDGTVQHVNPDKEHFTNQSLPASQSEALTWDDIFVESEAQNRPVAPPPRPIDQINAETRNEFEFVIPETY